jgi:hypothetical protein
MTERGFQRVSGEVSFLGFTSGVWRTRKSFAVNGTAKIGDRHISVSAVFTDVPGSNGEVYLQQLHGVSGEVIVSATIAFPPKDPIFAQKWRDGEEVELRLNLTHQGKAAHFKSLERVIPKELCDEEESGAGESKTGGSTAK